MAEAAKNLLFEFSHKLSDLYGPEHLLVDALHQLLKKKKYKSEHWAEIITELSLNIARKIDRQYKPGNDANIIAAFKHVIFCLSIKNGTANLKIIDIADGSVLLSFFENN